MKKRALALFLALTMLAGLAACGGGADTPESESPSAAVTAPVSIPETGPAPSDEYQRAVWYGFVSEELADADPDNTVVTWKQYCAMLGAIIAAYDESKLPEWERTTAAAPDTEMKRDGAMVSLLFAAKAMDRASFNAERDRWFWNYSDTVWDVVTMDYPVFDWNTPIDLGEDCSDNNHVGPAYDFCLGRVSRESGKALLEFTDTGDLRLGDRLTLREAALSALRLYESDNVQRLEPEYVPVAEVGTFTLPEELREKALAMPEVTREHLPAWHGIHSKLEYMAHTTGRNFYLEEDVQRIADMGCFDYIGLGYEHWQYTKEENGQLYVDMAVMRNIDEYICWCIDRGIHVGFNTCSIPGYLVWAASGYPDDIMENQDHYRQAQELVAMLARRYAGVPANAMSYFLIGETNPEALHGEEGYVGLVTDLVAAIREYDTEKVLFTAGMDEYAEDLRSRPIDALYGVDVVQSSNLYLDTQMYGTWPTVFVNGCISYDDERPLTVNGDFPAGTEVRLQMTRIDRSVDHIDADDLTLHIGADGEEIYSLNVSDISQGKSLDLGTGYPVTAVLEKDTRSITIYVTCSQQKWDGRNVTLSCVTLKIPAEEAQYNIEPLTEGRTYEAHTAKKENFRAVNIWCAELDVNNNTAYSGKYAPSTVYVNEDGSYENPEQAGMGWSRDNLKERLGRLCESNAAHGTAAWICEIGYTIELPKEVRAGFARDFAAVCDELGLPWCMYCNQMGRWTPYIHESALRTGSLSLPEDYEAEGYSYKNGYYYDEVFLDAIRS